MEEEDAGRAGHGDEKANGEKEEEEGEEEEGALQALLHGDEDMTDLIAEAESALVMGSTPPPSRGQRQKGAGEVGGAEWEGREEGGEAHGDRSAVGEEQRMEEKQGEGEAPETSPHHLDALLDRFDNVDDLLNAL